MIINQRLTSVGLKNNPQVRTTRPVLEFYLVTYLEVDLLEGGGALNYVLLLLERCSHGERDLVDVGVLQDFLQLRAA